MGGVRNEKEQVWTVYDSGGPPFEGTDKDHAPGIDVPTPEIKKLFRTGTGEKESQGEDVSGTGKLGD